MRTETGIISIGGHATAFVSGARLPTPIVLSAVNGWRGVTAIVIAFWHLWLVTRFVAVGDLRPIALLVDFFFVLSGLLIARAYMEKLRRSSTIPEYIVRRFGRIWPVHATMLALLVAYELVKLALRLRFGTGFSEEPFATGGVNPASAIWTNLLMVHSLGIHQRETWNFPSWSLSVEFVTYVVFAGFCLLRPTIRRATSLAIIAVSLAIIVEVAPDHMRSTHDYGVFRCIAGFFAGSLLYDVLRSVRLPSWPVPTIVEGLAVILVLSWLSCCIGTPLAAAAPVVFCLFVLAFVQGRGALSKMLSTKPFQLLAELSFTIYMVHAVVLVLLMATLHAWARVSGASLFTIIVDPYPVLQASGMKVQVLAPRSDALLVAIGLLYMGSVLIASYVAYRFVEIPARVFFNALAERLPAMSSSRKHAAPVHRAPRKMGPT